MSGKHFTRDEALDWWTPIVIVVIVIVFVLSLKGCALVKTTRCAEIEAKGINIVEPLTGTFLQLGTLKYKRIAAPETYTGAVNCVGNPKE